MKKLLSITILILTSISISGCFKRDTMQDITIYTSVYPIEYVVESLYGEHSEIISIYPDSVNTNLYELTEKQINDYSESELFIYNGLEKELDYALKMLNKNKNLKLIDASMSLEYENNIEEIWLNPSNLLELARNVKNGFHEYISSTFLKREINDKHEELQITISELDAETQVLIDNAPYKTIVASNDLFKYLSKYNLNVISLEENDDLTEKKLLDVKTLIENKEIKYIFMIQDERKNKTIEALLEEFDIEVLYFNPLNTITEEQRENNEDYLTITKNNIEQVKKELYK